jgi:predicted ATPase
MLRDLTIKNYRAFKDFSIDGLARVNLIVGKNNAGKTSFLEAVYLLVNQYNPSVLFELLDGRGEFAYLPDAPGRTDYQTAHIFHDFQLSIAQLRPNEAITISSQHEETQSLKIKVDSRKSTFGSAQPGLQLNVSYNAPIEEAGQALNISDNYFFSSDGRFTAVRRAPSKSHFVGTSLSEFDYLASLWDRLSQNPEEEAFIVSALQLLEPRVEDIRFASQQTAGRVLLKLAHRQDRFPISSMGEGLRRMLTLAIHAAVSENGALLIDEIDTGLYHGVQADVWRFLIETAQRLNVQIFATTHSWDCVAAFQEALESLEEAGTGRLFRLQESGAEIHAVRYEADELAVAVHETIEVR